MLFPVLFLLCAVVRGQALRPEYVEWGQTGVAFPKALRVWQRGMEMSVDDEFFISRVRPHRRFRNAATQVLPEVGETDDRGLIYWVPVGTLPNGALPDGVFDRDVFSMWSYVTHLGDWTAPFVRVPGALLDVAHRNGVPVSATAVVPAGRLQAEGWGAALAELVETGADKMADYLSWYGVDGLGYNSEFYTFDPIMPLSAAEEPSVDMDIVRKLGAYHESLVRTMRQERGNAGFDNIWYDGTNEAGYVTFDAGLGDHNIANVGTDAAPRASLFLNYNWNQPDLLAQTLGYARSVGCSPQRICCGFNMQGMEPRLYEGRWPLLAEWPFSIGLWGAHNESMLFESRSECGAAPAERQHTYLCRQERWFTGSTFNPISSPAPDNSMQYSLTGGDFCGMSALMTARSALCWDLGEEPFVSHFGLGNGRFYHCEGLPVSCREWYNIGLQDHLPTWRWWWSSRLLGRSAADVPAGDWQASLGWDDAWLGGGCLTVGGSGGDAWLHLFKTAFPLQAGDVVRLRFKRLRGSARASLCLTAEGDEATPVAEESLQWLDPAAPLSPEWQTVCFRLDERFDGKTLALMALHFSEASDFSLRIGEIALLRPATAALRTPDAPLLLRASVLHSGPAGVDGKLRYRMPGAQSGPTPCYNADVAVGRFHLYAWQEGGKPCFVGATTSWAGLCFAAPFDFRPGASQRIRFGVSALSMDLTTQSDTVWSDWLDVPPYEPSDSLCLPTVPLSVGEPFRLCYADSLHEPALLWELTDSAGRVAVSQAASVALDVPHGLPAAGNYTLRLTPAGGSCAENAGTVQVMPADCGVRPRIQTLAVADTLAPLLPGELPAVTLRFTSTATAGRCSRGVDLRQQAFGFRAAGAAMADGRPFSIAFWVKPVHLWGSTQLLNIRDKSDRWDNTEWGFFWHTVGPDGHTDSLAVRGSEPLAATPCSWHYDGPLLQPGVWTHLAYVFSYDSEGRLLFTLYRNGKALEPAGWQRGECQGQGAPPPLDSLYALRPGNVVAVGGPTLRKCALDGCIDDMQYWDKALTPAEVALAMGGIESTSCPDGLLARWSMEVDAGPDGTFANDQPGLTLAAGSHYYAAGDSEGQGSLCWVQPQYAPGCPFLPGQAYDVTTTATWTAPGGRLLHESHSDTLGTATIAFPAPGHRQICLSLQNGYGLDTRTIHVQIPDAETRIDLPRSPLPVRQEAGRLHFQAPGRYRLCFYTYDGRLVYTRTLTARAGDSLPVPAFTLVRAIPL